MCYIFLGRKGDTKYCVKPTVPKWLEGPDWNWNKMNMLQIAEETHLSLNERCQVENMTRKQRLDHHWRCVRKYRITASQFGTISIQFLNICMHCFRKSFFIIVKRNKGRDCQKMMERMINPLDISQIPAVKHGIHNEPIVIEKYSKHLVSEGFDKQDIHLMRPGFMIDENFGWLGCTPDLFCHNKKTDTNFVVEVNMHKLRLTKRLCSFR